MTWGVTKILNNYEIKLENQQLPSKEQREEIKQIHAKIKAILAGKQDGLAQARAEQLTQFYQHYNPLKAISKC